MLTPGQAADCPQAQRLLGEAARLLGHYGSLRAEAVLADRGYDSDALVAYIVRMEAQAVIPARKHRRLPRPHHAELYRERNQIERFFGWAKHFRRIATRYEKTAVSFLAMLHLVGAMAWLR